MLALKPKLIGSTLCLSIGTSIRVVYLISWKLDINIVPSSINVFYFEFCTEIRQIKKKLIKLRLQQKNFPNYTLKPALRTAGFERRHVLGFCRPRAFFFHFPPSSCLLPLLLPLRRSCRCSFPGAYSLLPLCSSDCSDPLRNGGRPAPPSGPPTQVPGFPCSVLIFGKRLRVMVLLLIAECSLYCRYCG